jgi:hypothetical protein
MKVQRPAAAPNGPMLLPCTRRRPSPLGAERGVVRYVRACRSATDHGTTVIEKVLDAVFLAESLISMVNEKVPAFLGFP